MIFVHELVSFSSFPFNFLIDLIFLCPSALSLLDLLASLLPPARTFQFLPGSQTALTKVSHYCNLLTAFFQPFPMSDG